MLKEAETVARTSAICSRWLMVKMRAMTETIAYLTMKDYEIKLTPIVFE